MKKLVIGARYKVINCTMTGLEGKLIAYDSERDAAMLAIGDSRLECTSDNLMPIDAPKLPRKRNYLVVLCDWATSDILYFDAPPSLSQEEVEKCYEEMDRGDRTEDENGNQVGWYDRDGEVVVGITMATSEEEAKEMFNYNIHTLKAYELA